jgi:uncharacterized membrane protein YhaH (DUF805 family)
MSHATTPAIDRPVAQQAGRINRSSFGLVIMLVIQDVLGAAYNLYGKMPSSGKSIGMFSSPLLAIHTIFGILLILAAIDLLVRSIRASVRPAVITSIIGLVAIIAGAGAGSAFTQDGANGASLGMAIASGVAMIAYLMNMRAPRGN